MPFQANGTSIYSESFMPYSLVSLRRQAHIRQSCRCFYCDLPIWLQDPTAFVVQHRLSQRQARLLQCTAEHLQPKSEGGADTASNVVAACRHCNQTRHKARRPLEPVKYRERVQVRLAKGRWWPQPILRILAPSAFTEPAVLPAKSSKVLPSSSR